LSTAIIAAAATVPLSARQVVTGGVYVGLIVGAALAAGRALAARVGGDGLDRALLTALGAYALPLTVGLALGAVGLLSPVPTLVANAAGGIAAVALHRRRAGTAEPAPPARSPVRDLAVILAVGLGAAFLVTAGAVGWRDGRSGHFESNHYHYAAVDTFATKHSIWAVPFENIALFTGSHPAGAEVVGAEVAFSTHGDHLLYGWLLPVTALLAMLSAAVIARELGGRPAVGAIAAIAVFASPWGFNVAHSLANDLVAVVGMTAGIAFLLRARREDHVASYVVAGAAFGIALGTKYTAYFPVAVILIALAVTRSTRRHVVALLPGMLVFALPWLVRNAISFHNPLYPQAVGFGGIQIFRGGSGPLDRYSGTFLGHIVHFHTAALRLWGHLVRTTYGPLMPVAVVGVAIAAWEARRRHRPALMTGAALTAVGFIGYAITPYTGGGNPPALAPLASNLRYMLFAVVLGLVVLCAALRPRFDLAVAVALCGWSVWELFAHPLRTDLKITPGVVAASLVAAVAVMAVAAAGLRLPAAPAVKDRLLPVATAGIVAVAAAGVLAGPRRTPDIAPLEVAVVRAEAIAQRTGVAHGPPSVAAIATTDLRSLIGGRFERHLERITSLLHPPNGDKAGLDRAAEGAHSAVLVIGSSFGLTKGYRPPADWCPVGHTKDGTVYVRAPSGGCPP
jgi:hypothetical protein